MNYAINIILKLSHTALILLCASFVCAAPLNGVDICFDRNIKSIQMQKVNSAAADPVIALGGSEQLLLTFDDLSGKYRSFMYKIIHCDADWNESDLISAEYINGFQQDNIQDYQQSFNTLTNYTFFSLHIPNDNTNILLSGNYKIVITDSDNPEQIVFQKGFSVVERTFPFKVQNSVNLNVLSENIDCMQQLNLKINYQNIPVQNPRSDLKVRITQNGYRTPVPPPAPVFITTNSVDYSLYDKNLYAGGAEYRQFDISSFEYRTLRVRKIEIIENQYNVLLEEDAMVKTHIAYQDINGRYIVRNARYEDNSNTESDYAQVFFTLLTHRPLNGRVYIFGEMTNRQLTDEYQMLYNAERKSYELSLLLKQGYYNYNYALLKDNGEIDFGGIEHCSNETENTYGIYVYYRSFSDRYDRLASITWISTKK